MDSANTGFDTKYPDYFFDKKLGTKEELILALKEIKTLGGHAMLYTNGRIVDPDSLYYKNGNEHTVCIGKDGMPYTEKYDSTPIFRVACPTSKEYQEYYAEQVKRLVGEYGAHGMQIDQISCNHAYFCYDKNHDHSTPANNFLPGVESLLKGARKIYQSMNTDYFVWCEGCHERFGQYYDIEQGHGEEFTWQIGEAIPEQFSYTYKNCIVTGISRDIQQLCHT